MCGQVVCRVPFDAADVGGCGDGGSFPREMCGAVVFFFFFVVFYGGGGVVVAAVIIGGFLWERDDVAMVEEDPEDLLGHVDDFLAPDAVRAREIDGCYEAWRLGRFGLGRIAEVLEDLLCSCFGVRR